MKLALFDLDGTLLPGDSDHAFGQFLIELGWADAETHRQANDRFYAAYLDGTLDIAQSFRCVITHIRREEFSFGRSLNRGCEAASGDILVFISGHCVPTDEHWLQRLCQPIGDGLATYCYGRQGGGPDCHYSVCCIFG